METAKRICLKNLPEKCTKREIADLVKNRTGAQPHSIDLGFDAEGEIRRYAHFSCEGAKSVLEVLGGGAVLRGVTVTAYPANVHYSYRYAEATRKREREEAEEKQNLESFWASHREHFLKHTNGGELPTKKPPKSFYATRQRYASIAAEIAAKCRAAHKAGFMPSQRLPPAADNHKSHAEHSHRYAFIQPPARLMESSSVEPPTAATAQSSGEKDMKPATVAAPTNQKKFVKGKPSRKAKPEIPVTPPPPPQPTKEERKLSVLQAKLVALKNKIGKK